MRELTFGYSPCPNDTFAFHALSHDVLDLPFRIVPVLLDIEELNRRAHERAFDLTKLSVGAFAGVGDRYVLEAMRAGGFNIGGEQSGHLILADHSTTGDGLVAALQVLAALVATGRSASELLHLFDPLPQLLKNVRYSGASPLKQKDIQAAIDTASKSLGSRGRLFIRESGTEPLIRVMAEALDAELMQRALALVADAVKAQA
jgi:phosphomannomutase